MTQGEIGIASVREKAVSILNLGQILNCSSYVWSITNFIQLLLLEIYPKEFNWIANEYHKKCLIGPVQPVYRAHAC